MKKCSQCFAMKNNFTKFKSGQEKKTCNDCLNDPSLLLYYHYEKKGGRRGPLPKQLPEIDIDLIRCYKCHQGYDEGDFKLKINGTRNKMCINCCNERTNIYDLNDGFRNCIICKKVYPESDFKLKINKKLNKCCNGCCNKIKA